MARDTYRIRLDCPELAAAIRPGQFMMLRLSGGNDPLLGRPFALYDTVLDAANRPVGVDVVYLVVGKMTGLLAALQPGDQLDVWGPLGNGFADLTGLDDIALVAGGIGQTPFLAYVRDLLGDRGYGGHAGPPRGRPGAAILRRPHGRSGGRRGRFPRRRRRSSPGERRRHARLPRLRHAAAGDTLSAATPDRLRPGADAARAG